MTFPAMTFPDDVPARLVDWVRRFRTYFIFAMVLVVLTAALYASAAADRSTDVFDVRAAGAAGDGKAIETKVIQQVIEKAAAQGGGIVHFPAGEYLTGTITLLSNVTLDVSAGAVIRGSGNRADYTRPSLIYAEDAKNVSIRGGGTIDGNDTAFWSHESGSWQQGMWRPESLMRFVRCENLLLEDFTARKSPSWTIHPIDCDRVKISGISIMNGLSAEERGPNTDGIDPDGCTRVRISDCYIQSGDDAIVLKVTRESVRRECRDITVVNCVLATHESALKLGSETYGEFRNIAFANCVIHSAGVGIGLWMRDGGLIDGWTVNNISMTLSNGGVPIYMTSYPRSRLPEPGAGPSPEVSPGTVRNIMISDVAAEADSSIFIQGQQEKPMEGIVIENFRVKSRGGGENKLNADPPYPFPVWGYYRTPVGMYCRYVSDLQLRNVQFSWGGEEKAEWGSALRCRDVTRLEIDGFKGRQSLKSSAPAVSLENTRQVFVHECWVPEGTGTFLELKPGTSDVAVMNNDLSHAQEILKIDSGVDRKGVFLEGNRNP